MEFETLLVAQKLSESVELSSYLLHHPNEISFLTDTIARGGWACGKTSLSCLLLSLALFGEWYWCETVVTETLQPVKLLAVALTYLGFKCP